MRFELTILGCNSAIPANGRFPTAQILNIQERLFLIDCGEGTQMRMNDYGIKRGRINQIFISHLHGDHIYGLIGLITSFTLMGRTNPLEIFAPKGLKEIIEVQLLHSKSVLSYPLQFHEVNCEKSQLIFEDEIVTVHSIPLIHRIPTTGYLFREQPRLPNMNSEKIKAYDIPYQEIQSIKEGGDFTTKTGQIIPHKELITVPKASRSFAYCSDTMYSEAIIPIIKGVDLLYHETTYCHDKLDHANFAMHSTAKQAAEIAKLAAVGKLITGHYSSRYIDLQPILEEAKSVFESVELGLEGTVYAVKLEKEQI